MRPLRFRLRTLMIAVALVAIGLGEALRPALPGAVHVTSKDPKIAVWQEKRLDGVLWGLSHEAACVQTESEGKPVVIYFGGINDTHGRRMEVTVFRRVAILPFLSRFATVRLDVDMVPIPSLTSAQRATLAEKNWALQADLAGDVSVPGFVALNEQGEVLASIAGYQDSKDFSAFLSATLTK